MPIAAAVREVIPWGLVHVVAREAAFTLYHAANHAN